LKYLSLGIFWIFKKTLKNPFLNIYHLILKIRIKKFKEKNSEFKIIPDKEKKSFHFLPYILFIFFAVLAITNNLFAKLSSPEEFGKDSILSKIIPLGQNQFITSSELIEESGPAVINNANQIVLESTGPQINSSIINTNTDEDNYLATTDNESTLIATNISSNALGSSMYRDKILEYTIQQGDTISGIAHKFNISVATILWSNNLSERSILKPGASIKILPTTGVLHKIARGDTIASIAKKYKADANKILSANQLSAESQIKIGQELIIPDGIRPTASSQIASVSKIISPIPSAAQKNTGTRLLWPAGVRRISQYYKWRHPAIDIAGPSGTAIYAAEDGVVEVSGWNAGGYGNYIIINHGNGIKTLYGHASKLYVGKGEKVERGQVIMAMGSTGRSTGPHLHFEVRVSGVKVNPLGYVR